MRTYWNINNAEKLFFSGCNLHYTKLKHTMLTVTEKFFDTLLPQNDFNDFEAYDYAEAMEPNWEDNEAIEHTYKNMVFIDRTNGCNIFLDLNDNYYRFAKV